MEANAQATDSTHFIATNQVGTAGAVGMNSILQLARRISAEGILILTSHNSFQQATACINVHWPSRDAKNGALSFHIKNLFNYSLDVDGLQAVDRAIEYILNYGSNGRLAEVCGDLDPYANKIEGEGHYRQI